MVKHIVLRLYVGPLVVVVMTVVPAFYAGLANAQTRGCLECLQRAGIPMVGEKITVTDTTRRLTGRVLEISSNALVITDGSHVWTVSSAEVRRIERRDSLKNGAWVGFLVGLGVGFAVTYPTTSYDGERFGLLALALGAPVGGVGAGVGSIIDFLVRDTMCRRRGFGAGIVPVATSQMVGFSVGW